MKDGTKLPSFVKFNKASWAIEFDVPGDESLQDKVFNFKMTLDDGFS